MGNLRINIVLLAIAAILAPFLYSFADTVSSTHFVTKDAFIGTFGGYASSTNFQLVTGGSPIINGNSTSTNFSSRTGPVNFTDFSPASQAWRWYDDANDETPTSSLAAQNVAPSNISLNQVIKLRLTIKETSGLVGNQNTKFKLQFAQSSDFLTSPGFVDESTGCASTSTWCYATSTGGNDNAIITTKVLSDASACAGSVGVGCGTHNTSGISLSTSTQAAGAATEYEFTLKSSSGVSLGSTYFFRAVDATNNTPILVNTTSSYPSLVTQGSALTFAISGLPQGTSTNGIVTDVSSTATSIPFGTLAIASSETSAQRLLVTTNAQNGYELYALQDSPLTDSNGHQISGVVAANTSPLPWSSACAATSTACYGYHPGSPVLSGGSTRFAANDSYAALTTSTAEVGYSGFAVTSSSFDMVYRIQIGNTQTNGVYQNNIVYIVASSF